MTCTEISPCEDTERRRPCTSQGETTEENNPVNTLIQTSSLFRTKALGQKLPNLSPCFCPYPSSLHYYSWWSDSSDTEVRSCHSSALVVFCLSKSKVLTMIFSTLDGLVPCHSSDLISHHSPSYSSLSSSPLASVLFLPHIICMARSFT